MDGIAPQERLSAPAGQVDHPPYAMPGTCPACGDGLSIVRLECATCGTAVVGRFRASAFARLTSDQMAFLEAFLRSRGNIRKVERQMGISYPTVRSRLDGVLAALGIAVGPEEDDESVPRRRREILDQLESGALSPDEAARRLRQAGR